MVSTLKEEGQPITWEVFKESLDARYGPTQFEDFFGDLTKFKQMGTVRDYQSQFERLLTRAGKLTPSQQVGCFISGLRERLRADVQASKPSTFSAAVGLARLYEARNQAQRRVAPPDVRRVTPMLTPSPAPATTPTIKKLTPEEIEDRRERAYVFTTTKNSGRVINVSVSSTLKGVGLRTMQQILPMMMK